MSLSNFLTAVMDCSKRTRLCKLLFKYMVYCDGPLAAGGGDAFACCCLPAGGVLLDGIVAWCYFGGTGVGRTPTKKSSYEKRQGVKS